VHRDLVAIGASAGGVEALKTVVAALPADLPATVLVALHLPATARSYLADILARSSALPVRQARQGLPVVPGEVVVATPTPTCSSSTTASCSGRARGERLAPVARRDAALRRAGPAHPGRSAPC
jgi:two-component system chemotaxis response regulator CheB